MEGYRDPFCRFPFPWGREEQALIETVRFLGTLRRENDCFADGDFRVIHHEAHAIAYERVQNGNRILVAANLGEQTLTIPIAGRWQALRPDALPSLCEKTIQIPPEQACIFKEVSV